MNEFKILFGNIEAIDKRALKPFDEGVCSFLGELSRTLMRDREARVYSDITTFAFFIRRANLARLTAEYGDRLENRLGRGLVFHIAPGNVPVNFAYTLIFGLLSGNTCIVKASSRSFRQTELITEAMNKVCEAPKYEYIKNRAAVVMYDRDNFSLTERFSALCNIRVIWGGNETINTVRRAPLPPRSFDITFADRYSLCVIGAGELLGTEASALTALARDFYNDTYLYDQNACSSPRLIYWLGSDSDIAEAKKRFWGAVHSFLAGKYRIEPVVAVDKYLMECRCAIDMTDVKIVREGDNLISRIEIHSMERDIAEYRCPGGSYLEYSSGTIDELFDIVDESFQTVSYYGIDPDIISRKIFENGINGIDRIVPIGRTADMGLIWDGYNLIESLSRVIC